MTWKLSEHPTFRCDDEDGMRLLRELFPDATHIDEMNLVMFSTSGVHGSYCTIEDAEADSPDERFVTFLVVHPRQVRMRYGNCIPRTPEDIAYLKSLREASWAAMASIGRAEAPR